MRTKAIEAKTTGMYLVDDGSTVFLINGQQRRRTLVVKPAIWNTTMPRRWMAWRSPLKAYVIAMVVRLALRLGCIVVIIGRCGIGKTMILERAMPHRIINRKEDVFASYETHQQGPSLRNCLLPIGHFAVDEFVQLDQRTLLQDLDELDSRQFAITIQSRTDLDKIGVTHWLEARKRLEITISPAE